MTHTLSEKSNSVSETLVVCSGAVKCNSWPLSEAASRLAVAISIDRTALMPSANERAVVTAIPSFQNKSPDEPAMNMMPMQNAMQTEHGFAACGACGAPPLPNAAPAA